MIKLKQPRELETHTHTCTGPHDNAQIEISLALSLSHTSLVPSKNSPSRSHLAYALPPPHTVVTAPASSLPSAALHSSHGISSTCCSAASTPAQGTLTSASLA